MAGRGSLSGLLPYGDANAIVVDMAREVLPIVEETPVLAGVCGTDPFRLMDVFLDELRRIGFSGVQNFPTVGLFDGTFRQGLEETGMGYGLEVDMIRLARELDLLTAPYVFTVDEARAMAEAGADVLVPHMGLTTGGTIGAETAKTLDDCVPLIQAMHDAAKTVNPDIIVLCHGGPIAEPDDAAYVLANTTGHRRLLRRLLDGAPADRGRDDREHAPLQVDSRHKGEELMSRFVMKDEVADRDFDWGSAGMRGAPPSTGCETYVVMDVELGARHRARLPQAPRPGRDDRRQVRAGRPVARARSSASSARATRSTSTGTSSTARTTTTDEPVDLQVILAPAYGEGGYEAVDVSGRGALGVAPLTMAVLNTAGAGGAPAGRRCSACTE